MAVIAQAAQPSERKGMRSMIVSLRMNAGG
jgi:hypothetical protein